MQPLPPRRRTSAKAITLRDYNYKDVLKNNISIDVIGSVIISKNDLDADMSLLKEIISLGRCIKFLDFESVLYVDKILKDRISNDCILVDDSLRINRGYIDLTKIKNIDLTIPLDYLVWGVKFNDKVSTYCFKYYNSEYNLYNYLSYNGNTSLSLTDLKKIKETIEKLGKYNIKDDKEKVYFISDFIQSRTQFIHGVESESNGRVFVTPNFPPPEKYSDRSGAVQNVLNNNNGICMGIANLSTLFLNNPVFDVEVESVQGTKHVWNKVLIDGKYYYFDNTWSITRSEYGHPDGLITLKFSRKYLLFGNETALAISSHGKECDFVYKNAELSLSDYGEFDYTSRFDYQKEPKYYSYRKN